MYRLNKSPVAKYRWEADRKVNLKEKPKLDNFILQSVLRSYGNYPPAGKSRDDCPITGVFGNCTELALKEFQTKYGITPTGTLGPTTRQFLNTLFSQ